tara:strand:+ start:5456 stop:6184 length:729 start_codon:yes stop_codon:yes gene_type:complete
MQNGNRNRLTDYIRATNDSLNAPPGAHHPEKDYFLFNSIQIYIRNPLPDNVDLIEILQKITEFIPENLIREAGIEMILVGQFEELERREIQSLYMDDSIYVTNEQSSQHDMMDDIVHEFAHALEDRYGLELYSDDLIENEFLLKRRHFYDILKSHGYEVDLNTFLNVSYDEEFDMFLYREIGYEKLIFLTMGLVVSPYGLTSLREYFATGFEEYFMPTGDRESLRQMSPSIYQKIEQIIMEK